jgi:hypothetical protein
MNVLVRVPSTVHVQVLLLLLYYVVATNNQHTSPKSNNDGFLRDFRSFLRGAQRSISVSSHARLSLPRCRGTVRGGGTLPLGAPRGIYSGGGWAPPTAQPLAALPRCKRSRRPPILGKAVGQDTRTARTLSTGKSHTPCGRHASVGVSANHCVRPLCGSQGVCAAVTAERSHCTRTGPVSIDPVHPTARRAPPWAQASRTRCAAGTPRWVFQLTIVCVRCVAPRACARR